MEEKAKKRGGNNNDDGPAAKAALAAENIPDSQRVKSAIAIDKEIRKQLKKPEGELTKADLEKVKFLIFNGDDLKGLENLTQLVELRSNFNAISDVSALKELKQLKELDLNHNQISDVSPLKELKQLKYLRLFNNPTLTKAQIAELQKALPKCSVIGSNPTK